MEIKSKPSRWKYHLEGQRFGHLLVLERIRMEHYKDRTNIPWGWKCLCDCGKEYIILQKHLIQRQIQSCDCRNRLRKDNPSSFMKVLSSYKQNAKNKNRSFTLTKDEFQILIFQNCHYCGGEPSAESKPYLGNTNIYNPITYYNGIDRVDSSNGYDLDNCVTCCRRCNVGKMELSKEDFLDWISRVHNHSNLTSLSANT